MKRIIAVGDSTVHGYSDVYGHAITTEEWPYRLMVRLGETSPTLVYDDIFINAYDDNDGGDPDANTFVGVRFTMLNSGVNGDDTVRILSGRGGSLARFQSDVLDRSPDFVIIMAGTNDLGMMGGAGDYSAANTAIRLFQMADAVTAIGATPVMVKIPAWGADTLTWVAALNAAIVAGASSRGLHVADVFTALCNSDGTKKSGMALSDGIHFTAAGNQAAADTFSVSWFGLDAAIGDDRIALSWTDSATAEDGWYVERRVSV